ncbi:unnamed protein product [Fusarium equiseti]|uniref:Uncharacterized protein n=1 Tax=Fusarium equiseti TaxID=61235 RepID=A0A8J2J061_FUSEQ|nr:unnamed protein product [Fusarium equiseti]
MQSNIGQGRPAGQPSVNQLPVLSPNDQKNIDGVQSMLDEVKGLMVSLRCDAIPSSQQTGDEATHSGFDPEDRSRIGDLVKECQAVLDLSKDLDKDTQLATLAYEKLDANSLADVQSCDDQQTRQTLATQVIRLLADSPDKFLALLHSLGIRTSPEFDANVQLALGQASPSQTDVLMRDTSRDELASLEKSHGEMSMKLKQAEDQVEVLKQRLNSTETERDSLQKDRSDKDREAEAQSRYAQRARSELTRQNGKIGHLESDLELERQDKSRLQNDRDRLENERDRLQSKLDVKDSKIADLQGSVTELEQEFSELQAAYKRVKKEKEQYKQRLNESAAKILSLKHEKGGLEVDLDKHRLKAVKFEGEAESLQDDLQRSESKLRKAEQKLAEAQIDLSESRGRLTSANQTSGESRERCRSLGSSLDELKKDLREAKQQLQDEQEQNSVNRRSIQEKDAQIGTLEGETGRLNKLITAIKNDGIKKMKQLKEAKNSQVEHAALLLRRLSIDLDSKNWNTVGETVLADSLTLANPVQWRPWDIVNSSSADESLSIRQHDRNANLIALDIMAILDVKEADCGRLLSYLQALQEALPGSLMIDSIRQLIPDWFQRAVGDPRLHIMHRVAMCQILGSHYRGQYILLT